ncbi:hypothetical protein IE81DRAFT_195962 [Ceraceosorus guamensis]|uniref:FHA domain-containing protein n=1 Tax=Ceraceosorus guamensis TaxID=1522189 RepID=A0A316VTY7_9BASI|nr:hypothetical protein IE81DRAFT_195962 [Ceraceosorus guamensis]PWN41057.1 hypothetical protein IE81DRAFT_195962 [Ceraceosorus guamensis]
MVWLIEGCFDGDGTKPFSKLIKPNAKYIFGRKEPADIVIKSKLISQEGGYLKTGAFNINDVADVHSRPSVEITAGKKGVKIVPAKEVHKWEANLDGYVGILINAGGRRSLEDGDLIIFASKLPLSLRWAPFAFSIPRDGKIEPEWVPMCAATGIHLAAGKNILPGCNFYMIEKAGLTLNVLTALATAMSIVTSSFLQKFLGTASLPRLDEESLEREFNELDPYDFQPPLGDDLIQPDALGDDADHSTVLVADHRRPHLLQGVSLLFVRTGTGETPHQSLLAERVGAKTSVIEPDTPDFTSDRALTRLISDYAQTAQTHLEAVKSQSTWITHESGLVILVEGTAAVGGTEWFLRLRRVALSLRIAMPLDGATCVTRTILRSSVKQILFRPPLDPLESASQLESVPRTDEPATQAPAPEPQLETEAESESVEVAKASQTLAKNPPLEPLQSEALAPANTTKRVRIAVPEPASESFSLTHGLRSCGINSL